MTITANDIQEQGFGTSRNGYDMQEVDIFLERVAEEIDQMQADFQTQLQQAMTSEPVEGNDAQYEAEIARLNNVIANLQAQLSSQQNEAGVISDAIISAQRSANQIKEEARLEIEQAYRDAEIKANEIVRDAVTERNNIMEEIDRLDKSRQSFVNQYVGMLNHFQGEASRSFPSSSEVSAQATQLGAEVPSQAALFEAQAQAQSQAQSNNYGMSPNASTPFQAQEMPAPMQAQASAPIPSNYASDDDDFDIEEID